jgi:hypothetical protein
MPEASDFDGVPQEHLDAILACADLAARSGGTEFEVGYMDEEATRVEDAMWYAHVNYHGARLFIDDQPSPAHACELLARRILNGGKCTNCGRETKTIGFAFPGGFPKRPAKSRFCQWRRKGTKWMPLCKVPA